MLRDRAWDALRRGAPPALRRRLKAQSWFGPLAARLFGTAVYSESYYADIERLEATSAPRIAAWIEQRLAPTSLLDVGCGSGLLMDALRARGISVRGVDLSDEALRLCRARELPVERFDLTRPGPLPHAPYDVVVSCEVAEHLQPEHAAGFVARMTDAAPVVYLTAAEPDAHIGPGLLHFNERPHGYWIELMHERGFSLDRALTEDARRALSGAEVVEYLRRPMIFRRDS